MCKHLSLFCLFFVQLFSSAFAQDQIQDAVVKLLVTVKEYNYRYPWQAPEQKKTGGSGVILEDGRILTNAHVVSNQSFIEVNCQDTDDTFLAELEYIAHDCDLALLKVRDEAFLERGSYLSFGKSLSLMDEISVYGFPRGGNDLSVTKGVISRMEPQFYSHSGYQMMACQMDAAINPGSSGGPVVKDGKIVGIAMQGSMQINAGGFFIPLERIEHFMSEIQKGHYQGVPWMGISLQALKNQSARAYYGLSNGQQGQRVAFVQDFSPAKNILFEDDVIIRIEGYPLTENGFCFLEDGTRLPLMSMVQRKFLGDFIELDILRDKESLSLKIPLTVAHEKSEFVPYFEDGTKPKYFIYGGIVMQPLSLAYLEQCFGKDNWPYLAPDHLLSARNKAKSYAKEELVIINQILTDRLNIGYQDLEKHIVQKVNGESIKSLKHLVQVIEELQEPYVMITTDHGKQLIFHKDDVQERQASILKKYQIPEDRKL